MIDAIVTAMASMGRRQLIRFSTISLTFPSCESRSNRLTTVAEDDDLRACLGHGDADLVLVGPDGFAYLFRGVERFRVHFTGITQLKTIDY